MGAAPINDSPTPATASAIAMRMALRRKNVVRVLIVGEYTLFRAIRAGHLITSQEV